MEYLLKVKVLGRTPDQPISEDQFKALCRARSTLSNALLMEEAYDLLVSNHQDFEEELAKISVEHMMRRRFSYEFMFADKAALSRRLANLLTAARIYVDQVPRYYARLMDDKNTLRYAREAMKREFDAHFAYRFMESYRNHVQHYSATVDSMMIGGARDQETMHLAFTVEPYAIKAKLELNRKFKKLVLDQMDERVDLRKMARGYVACFSRIHHQLRAKGGDTINEARSLVEQAVAGYAELQGGEKPVGLHAIHRNGDTEIESFPLLLDWDDTRQWLVKRNKRLEDLGRHYITTQLGKDK